jgi:hypothetical protein
VKEDRQQQGGTEKVSLDEAGDNPYRLPFLD